MTEPTSGLPPSDLTPSLLVALRSGDDRAGELLQRIYHEPIRRYCCSFLGNDEAAEDAAQAIFIRILESDQVPNRLRSWIYRIARNRCLNLIRQREQRGEGGRLPTAFQFEQGESGPLTRLARRERLDELARMVSELSESQQEILHLRFAAGLSRAEMAEVLQLPESVVKSRLFEALDKLRRGRKPLEE